jgi:hypothetical protein
MLTVEAMVALMTVVGASTEKFVEQDLPGNCTTILQLEAFGGAVKTVLAPFVGLKDPPPETDHVMVPEGTGFRLILICSPTPIVFRPRFEGVVALVWVVMPTTVPVATRFVEATAQTALVIEAVQVQM